jgi:N-acetylneuraminic acid mutarotase
MDPPPRIFKLCESIFTGHTKIIVAGGFVGTKTDSVEIIDLKSSTSSTSCKSLPNLPVPIYGSVGGLDHQGMPVVCGGVLDTGTITDTCYTFSGKHWITSASMHSARLYASVYSGSKVLFVTGGQSGGNAENVNTAELLTDKHGWEKTSAFLPVSISSHCSVYVNSTMLMLIGGIQREEEDPSSLTYFLNTESGEWRKGPQLKMARRHHSCGRIRKGKRIFFLIIIFFYFFWTSLVSVG